MRWNRLGALKAILQLGGLSGSPYIQERPAPMSGDWIVHFKFQEVACAGCWYDRGLLQPFAVISEWSCLVKLGLRDALRINVSWQEGFLEDKRTVSSLLEKTK